MARDQVLSDIAAVMYYCSTVYNILHYPAIFRRVVLFRNLYSVSESVEKILL